ncbi:MAG: acyl-CoA synthetase FdrA [Thermoanaerobaculia bacterium]|nr:acyl-CoA synthetase FdrA [Thermoanaerobaculia bacterium]
MSEVVHSNIRAGSYHDSVVLLRLQRGLTELPGVLDAGVAMATAANRELLRASGLWTGAADGAGDADLVIVVRAETDAAAVAALARVDGLLAVRAAGGSGGYRPRSLGGALRQAPGARWVLISIPGRYAAAVADQALDAGRSVFLYSDNVARGDELVLKRKAAERGLLVLGPDCGTAIVAAAGLGFANRVRPGGIGLIGPSGTGLQMVASRIHALGGGVSHALGTGGRDLSLEIGGLAAEAALDLLARDPATKVLVIVSKPPAPAVATRLLARARATGKPVVACFLGLVPPGRRLGPVSFAAGLAEAAELAVSLAKTAPESIPESPGTDLPESRPTSVSADRPHLRGLFSGGTLAYEAQLALELVLTPLWSNAPVGTVQPLPDPWASRDHTILDLGADEFTVGRLHPMLDPDLRLRRLRAEAADPSVGLLVLDVVLGDGAHADPAGVLAPEIERVLAARRTSGPPLRIVTWVVGTDADSQDLAEQQATLERAGARVVHTAEELVELVLEHLAPAAPPLPHPVPLDLLAAPLDAINVGLETFGDSLRDQGARVLQVDWRPPAGGNERLAGLLARLK